MTTSWVPLPLSPIFPMSIVSILISRFVPSLVPREARAQVALIQGILP
jgi:hypothetical protein